MSGRAFSGLFLGEGSSDSPLAGIIESLFSQRGVRVRLASPDFARLPRVATRSVEEKMHAAVGLVGESVDVVVVHRDTDNADAQQRTGEISMAFDRARPGTCLVPVVPIRTTESWLLLDEPAIRYVAGNPRGRIPLSLPLPAQAEIIADPKGVLGRAILLASETSGRRRDKLRSRFGQNRRFLLERLDVTGPVTQLSSWNSLLEHVDSAVACLSSGGE